MACSVGSDGGMKSSNYVALVSFCEGKGKNQNMLRSDSLQVGYRTKE